MASFVVLKFTERTKKWSLHSRSSRIRTKEVHWRFQWSPLKILYVSQFLSLKCVFSPLSLFFLGCSTYSNQHHICIATFPNCNHRLTQRCVKFPKLNQATLSVRIIHINDREGEKKNSKTLKIIESNLKKTSFLKTTKTGTNSITFDIVASSSCRIHFHLTNHDDFSAAWNLNEDILANKWRITIKRLCFSRVHTVVPSTAWVTLASRLVAIIWAHKDNAFNLHYFLSHYSR